MTWHIYLLRCVVNEKLYVGQTKQVVIYRWRAHVHDALHRRGRVHCPALRNAIRKHGASTFEIYVLDKCESQEDANIRERAWIAELKCRAPDGYNLDEGGGAAPRHPETLARIGARSRAAWAALTPEARILLTEKKRKSALEISDETSERIRLAWAAMTPERRSEIAKKRWEKRTDRGAAARATWAALSPDERTRRRARFTNEGLKYNSTRTPEQLQNASRVLVAGRKAAARARSNVALLSSLQGRCMALVFMLSGPYSGEMRKVRRGVYREDWSPQVWVSLKGARPRITSQVTHP